MQEAGCDWGWISHSLVYVMLSTGIKVMYAVKPVVRQAPARRAPGVATRSGNVDFAVDALSEVHWYACTVVIHHAIAVAGLDCSLRLHQEIHARGCEAIPSEVSETWAVPSFPCRS